MTLRVGVDGAPLRGRSGVARYLSALLSATATAAGDALDIEVVTYGPGARRTVPTVPKVRHVRPKPIVGHAFAAAARIGFPVRADALLRDLDVMLLTRYWNGAPASVPQFSLVYDLVWEHAPFTVERGYRDRLRRSASKAIEASAMIGVMSKSVESEVQEAFPAVRGRVVHLPPGPSTLLQSSAGDASAVAAAEGVSDPFCLAVGTIEPRKNWRRLIEAWATGEIPAQLVLVGRPGWDCDEVLGAIRGMPDVCHLPEADDCLLAHLYKRAQALVFPSVYEGFGLPLLEAAEAGLAIACSDIPVFREVVGDAGVYFDPYDVGGMVAAILHVLTLARPLPAVVERQPPPWTVAGGRLAQALSMLASP